MGDTWVDCTGDACVGDIIKFKEIVWTDRGKSIMGRREITAEIVKDSYGVLKQQHTFSLSVMSCTSDNPALAAEIKNKIGNTIRRMGRNIYRNGTQRQIWADESIRKEVISQKHKRGDIARNARAIRKEKVDLL